ncbi:MAG: hypothetical protein GDA67_06055 [Nitrospira sp. CR1.3]|nr:hypothetical protein [Nitrospira sp. CR1.3]
MNNVCERVKRTAGAAALAVATVVGGVAGQAQAFSFTEGDVVVALWGNNTEALYNLGAASAVFAAGPDQTLDVSAGLTAASSGGNPVRISVFSGNNFTGQILGGTPTALSGVNRDNVSPFLQLGTLGVWGPGSNFSGNTIAKADPNSFSSRVAVDQPSIDGTWPVDMFGGVGTVLNVLSAIDGEPGLTQVGRVLLAAGSGLLQFGNPGPGGAPIPVPAAAILFGSGLIGLAGVARRSMLGTAA